MRLGLTPHLMNDLIPNVRHCRENACLKKTLLVHLLLGLLCLGSICLRTCWLASSFSYSGPIWHSALFSLLFAFFVSLPVPRSWVPYHILSPQPFSVSSPVRLSRKIVNNFHFRFVLWLNFCILYFYHSVYFLFYRILYKFYSKKQYLHTCYTNSCLPYLILYMKYTFKAPNHPFTITIIFHIIITYIYF